LDKDENEELTIANQQKTILSNLNIFTICHAYSVIQYKYSTAFAVILHYSYLFLYFNKLCNSLVDYL